MKTKNRETFAILVDRQYRARRPEYGKLFARSVAAIYASAIDREVDSWLAQPATRWLVLVVDTRPCAACIYTQPATCDSLDELLDAVFDALANQGATGLHIRAKLDKRIECAVAAAATEALTS